MAVPVDKKFFAKISFYALSILVYGLLYYTFIGADNFHFSGRSVKDKTESEKLYDLVYFSAITQSTVGYGDVYPTSPAGKFLVMTQLLVPFLVVLS